jgi:hypothetical protein
VVKVENGRYTLGAGGLKTQLVWTFSAQLRSLKEKVSAGGTTLTCALLEAQVELTGDPAVTGRATHRIWISEKVPGMVAQHTIVEERKAQKFKRTTTTRVEAFEAK